MLRGTRFYCSKLLFESESLAFFAKLNSNVNSPKLEVSYGPSLAGVTHNG